MRLESYTTCGIVSPRAPPPPIAQVRLIAEWRDLLSKVSDQQALLASLRDSPYFAPFKDTAAQYETKLARLGDALQALNQVRGPKRA